MLRLQKALTSIAYVGNAETKALAMVQSQQAFERAELVIEFKNDLDILKKECMFSKTNTSS